MIRQQFVILAISLTLPAAGQAVHATGGISPIPVLAQGATVPSDSTNYVFLGPSVRQLTLSFPAGLANGDATGLRTTYQVALVNQVALSLVTDVAPAAAGSGYDYAYTIQNGSDAKDGVKVWSIGVPSADAVSSTQHATWQSTTESAAVAPAGTISAGSPLSFTTWRNPSGAAIAPGLSENGFHVYSGYLPGFTLGYARSAEDLSLPVGLPAAVTVQLAVVRTPQWLNQSFVTIGPRYPRGWSKQFMANDYLYGIARLTNAGQLSANSAFVAGARAALTTFVETQGAGASPALDFLGQASGTLESSIASAMRLAFQ